MTTFAGNRPKHTQETVPSADRTRLIALFNAGQYAELENQARTLAKKHPNSPFIWKVLGVSLLSQGKDALPALKKTTILSPQDAEAHNNLGAALRDRGQLGDALESYQRALARNPEYAEAYNNRGIAMQDLGQLDEAAVSFRQALKIKPHFPEASSNLGNALQLSGKLEAAVASYRQSLADKPDQAAVHFNMGDALQALGRFDDAIANYRHALELNLDQADVHCNIGNALQASGRSDEAVKSYLLALETRPDYAEVHCSLGNALRNIGKSGSAIASYRQAIELKPEYAEAHHDLAVALEDMGQLDACITSFKTALTFNPGLAEAYRGLGTAWRTYNHSQAEASCQRALQINPRLVAAIVMLATLTLDNGQFHEAEDILRRAISIDPESPEAWSGIANLRKMTIDDADWLSNAERLVGNNLLPRNEVLLRYAIGKYYDDVKNYDQAFLNYRRANDLSKQHGLKFDRQAHTQQFDAICKIYDATWISKKRAHANSSIGPVFILGMPRSGTSLAEQIASSHPSVFGAGELTFWMKASSKIEPANILDEAGDKMLRALAEQYLQLFKECPANVLRVVDKMPQNFQCIGLIRAAFPNARFIHMTRNPIDTCLSVYFQRFAPYHSYANDLGDIAHYYEEYVRIMKHWQLVLPQGSIFDVPYEGLVADQEAWSRKMLEFIGLPWDARCLDFHQNTRTVMTASNWQVRQKIGNASIERWCNYEKHAGPLLHLLEQNLHQI